MGYGSEFRNKSVAFWCELRQVLIKYVHHCVYLENSRKFGRRSDYVGIDKQVASEYEGPE